ncbi:MAG: hypothetical protein DWI04_08380 [Planctomycetota bacterium]|nr:MAG: hypothetical protein DWI04_08380 [Planctomycetota bacterium]
MRRGDADDAVDERERFEEVGTGHLPSQFGPQPDLVERHLGNRLPDLVARRDDLQLRVQPPHAVPDEHEVAHRGILPLGIALPHGGGELLPQFRRRLQKGGTSGIVEHPRLVPPVKLRPGPEFVDHVEPRALVAGEAVDEHHRNPARLVWLEHLKMRPGAAVAEGLEEARDARLRCAVEHVQKRCREVGGKVGLGGTNANGGDLDGVCEVEHRGRVVAGHRAGELLQDVFIARHGEAEHGGGGERLPRGREAPRFLRSGTVRHADHHRQPEAVAEVAAAEPLVLRLPLRLDRRDARRIDGERLRSKGNEHRPASWPHPQSAIPKAVVPSRGLEKSGKRVGVCVSGVYQQVAIVGIGPGSVPRLLAGQVVAIHRMAIAFF